MIRFEKMVSCPKCNEFKVILSDHGYYVCANCGLFFELRVKPRSSITIFRDFGLR